MSHPKTNRVVRIGLPDQEGTDPRPLLPGWQVPLIEYFTHGAPLALYEYDFGDDWEHVIYYEGASPAESSQPYPRCTGGARACPPEDIGGPRRYADVLAAIGNPGHPDRAELLAGMGDGFDPAEFDPAAVTFDDPQERLKMVFEE